MLHCFSLFGLFVVLKFLSPVSLLFSLWHWAQGLYYVAFSLNLVSDTGHKSASLWIIWTHDKELFTIFKAFKTWQHYLEGSASPVDVVTNHKNLEYFSTSKVLTHWQVRWSEYLCQFNLVIHFQPSKLDAKPNTLTRWWDIYPKKRDKGFTWVNLEF